MSPATRNSTRIYPLRILKEQIVALDAAMLVAVTSTEAGAVHKLRTTTRRVQAHVALLDLLGTGDRPVPVPDHSDETAAVLRRLRRVRRVAGAVRDLDVQTNTIRLDAPQKSAVHKGSPGDTVRKQAKKLRKFLEQSREEEAAKLVAVLKAEEKELAAELRALEQAVKSAHRAPLSAAGLIQRVQRYFNDGVKSYLRSQSKSVNISRDVDSMHEEDLHSIRKLAKACRYMLEGAPEGSPAESKAHLFEELQEVGGTWHDWLLLAQLSETFHGRKAELTQRYAKHARAAEAEYRLRLTEFLSASGAANA